MRPIRFKIVGDEVHLLDLGVIVKRVVGRKHDGLAWNPKWKEDKK